ncbi:MAG: DEAD/DEAH box helicase [Patescibacteria group bacterium]
MRQFNKRSSSSFSNHNGGSYGRRSQNGNRGFSGGFGGRGNNRRSGMKQSIFDPSSVIAKSKTTNYKPQTEETYEATNQFSDFKIVDELKNNISFKKYTTPTPIQDQVIPHILEGKDVVGIANTGTGKTAAFLIPLLNKVVMNPTEKVLIIVPTRELAVQVRDELASFSYKLNIYSTLCIGGSNINSQINSLKRGQHFVIGTPGRLKDLNQKRKIRFEEFNNIVLDEVDRMLDMGFVKEVKLIIESLAENRQSLFFSATMSTRVEEIMRGFLTDPVHISIKTKQNSGNIEQKIVKIQGRSKLEMLHEFLINESYEKVLVFGRTKRGAEKLSRDLQRKGLKVNAIHGNKSQGQRQKALQQFRANQLQALIATDVVARGLDIDNVTHVINYDLPGTYEDYIHRIGRTGRANKKGIALTFI